MVFKMKNLVREYLRRKFFKDKNEVIGDHIIASDNGANVYQFKSGRHYVVILNSTAYSRNGYFFSVILKDNDYIESIEKNQKEKVLEYLDNDFASKYEDQEEENIVELDLE